LCCFHTNDAAKVTVRLGALETLLKKYVKAEELSKLFSDPSLSLTFNGQAAPLKKGKSSYRILDVPPETSTYATKAMKKLYTPAPRNLADDYANNSAAVTVTIQPSVANQRTVTPTTFQPAPPDQRQGNQPCRFTTIETNLSTQSSRLDRLETCCTHLAETTQTIANQISIMNDNVNKQFQEMAITINQIGMSPNDRRTKIHKNNSHMDTDL
jgi:hypothetical protein